MLYLLNISLCFCRETDDIAILIVIITHEHNAEQFSKVNFSMCIYNIFIT